MAYGTPSQHPEQQIAKAAETDLPAAPAMLLPIGATATTRTAVQAVDTAMPGAAIIRQRNQTANADTEVDSEVVKPSNGGRRHQVMADAASNCRAPWRRQSSGACGTDART